jgi:hypothetical protein
MNSHISTTPAIATAVRRYRAHNRCGHLNGSDDDTVKYWRLRRYE